MTIIQSNSNFNLEELSVEQPNGMQGGTYCCNIKYNGDDMLLQTTKCELKNFKPNKGYIDIVVDDTNYIYDILQDVENHMKDYIFEKQHLWFNNNLEESDIDYLFSDSLKKSKKNLYFRVYLPKQRTFRNVTTFKVFNENEQEISLDSIEPNTTKKVISIFQLNSLKFTSTSFKLFFVIKQMLVLDNINFSKCIIQTNVKENKNNADDKKNEMENVEND